MVTFLSLRSLASFFSTVTPGQLAVGAGDQVEKRGLAAVGVTRQCDMDLRIRHSILLPYVPALLSPHGLDNVLQSAALS